MKHPQQINLQTSLTVFLINLLLSYEAVEIRGAKKGCRGRGSSKFLLIFK
jgi:hypothetical protein